ncbi:hypothetical protein FQN57_000388 [Myotisia sp. PD_48]|nr:hypothetical protein FQN57_000388 [Myotisia sp. PD_48]
MASISSTSSFLIRKSTMRCLQYKPSSLLSISYIPKLILFRPQFGATSLSSTPQFRHFVTRIVRPFSSSPKSTRSQASLGAQKTLDNKSSLNTSPPLPLTNLPYFIRRTPSNQLPIYLVTKAGGTKQQTRLRKTEGDLSALKADLIRYLRLEDKPNEVAINQLNGHITIKGWRKPEVQQFLLDRRF